MLQLHQQVEQSHLAALAGADPVVVSRGLVLAHEAGLVDPGRGQRRGGAGDQLLRAAALSLDGWGENVEVTRAHCYFVMLESIIYQCTLLLCYVRNNFKTRAHNVYDISK